MFRFQISPEAAERIARDEADVVRLWSLPDRFLAAALLRMSRAAADADPDMLGHGGWGTYEHRLVWQVVPEVAFRLGETSFRTNERPPAIRRVDDEILRVWAGACIQNATAQRPEAGAGWRLLTREPANGNPLLIALDRVFPPDRYSEDYGARMVREAAGYRGFEDATAWRPEMQVYEAEVSKMLL